MLIKILPPYSSRNSAPLWGREAEEEEVVLPKLSFTKGMHGCMARNDYVPISIVYGKTCFPTAQPENFGAR